MGRQSQMVKMKGSVRRLSRSVWRFCPVIHL